jgi:hypothetical protein
MSTGTPDASWQRAQGSLINPSRSSRHERERETNNTGDTPSPMNISGGPLQANNKCNKRKASAADPPSLATNDNTCNSTISFNNNNNKRHKRSCTQLSSNQRSNTTSTRGYLPTEATLSRKRKVPETYSTSPSQARKRWHEDFK